MITIQREFDKTIQNATTTGVAGITTFVPSAAMAWLGRGSLLPRKVAWPLDQRFWH